MVSLLPRFFTVLIVLTKIAIAENLGPRCYLVLLMSLILT